MNQVLVMGRQLGLQGYCCVRLRGSTISQTSTLQGFLFRNSSLPLEDHPRKSLRYLFYISFPGNILTHFLYTFLLGGSFYAIVAGIYVKGPLLSIFL